MKTTSKMVRIRALSVEQPYADLIALGRKTAEIRSRRSHYRGPLLIVSTLKPAIIPAGYAVAIVIQTDCRPMERSDEEIAFCRWRPDYWARIFTCNTPVVPFPVQGAQGCYWVEFPHEVLDHWRICLDAVGYVPTDRPHQHWIVHNCLDYAERMGWRGYR